VEINLKENKVMSIERIFQCDNQDCKTKIGSLYSEPEESGWLTVSETGLGAGVPLNFCCLACLRKYCQGV
jgi:hypothetical protein